MNDAVPPPHAIRYHSRSRMLELSFADGSRFELRAETLRARPAGDTGSAGSTGIAAIAPWGGGIVLHFEDGHASEPLAWSDLYRIGASESVTGGSGR